MVAANGVGPHANGDVNAAGQPDTPVEVLTALLGKALQQQDPAAVKQLVEQAHALVAGLDPYLDQISTPPSQVCQDLISASLSHGWREAHEQGKTLFLQKSECCAGALEGRFIATLCRLTGAKTVLEVGMFTGTTTLAVAQSIPDDGQVYALEIEQYMKDFSEPYFKEAGVDKKVTVVVGSADEGIKTLAEKGVRFDLAFLDADKGGYLGYYNQLMDNNLIVPGGAIVADNTLMKGRPYTDKDDELGTAIREFNEAIRNDDRVEVIGTPFRDGVSIIMRKQVADGDDVNTGLARNNILQRFKLNGQTALITGAGQGIGRAFAHALGEAGAAVAVVDVNGPKAEAVRDELAAKGIRSIAVTADITKADACNSMVAQVVEQLGGLDIAINNAGVNRNHAAEECSEEDWDLTFNLNTRAVFLCCQAEGRHMLQQGRGKIINTASMASLLVPHPQKQIAYNASKSAVVKMTQTLGCEWADRGVRVNCISPGIVNTELIQKSKDLQPLVSEWVDHQIPTHSLAEVTDLQTAIVFMASPASNYMVGHNLVLEGGQSLW
jgi:NAD(P)-dependent dehydrogenase (short-subunit alcohol dehydrogenase family)/predicted O-methyltransferase YrrM